jgi:hypothetical protein
VDGTDGDRPDGAPVWVPLLQEAAKVVDGGAGGAVPEQLTGGPHRRHPQPVAASLRNRSQRHPGTADHRSGHELGGKRGVGRYRQPRQLLDHAGRCPCAEHPEPHRNTV